MHLLATRRASTAARPPSRAIGRWRISSPPHRRARAAGLAQGLTGVAAEAARFVGARCDDAVPHDHGPAAQVRVTELLDRGKKSVQVDMKDDAIVG